MRQILEKISTECAECGTPLNGANLRRRGDKYYCAADYDRTSPEEKAINREMKKESEFWQELLGTDTKQLTLNHNFDDWTTTNATVSSDKVWVGTTTGGKISKDLDLEFGSWYTIKVVASPSAGSIVCYNSTDGTKQLGTNSFEDRFIALTGYIEFRNTTIATNTISLIEVRKL